MKARDFVTDATSRPTSRHCGDRYGASGLGLRGFVEGLLERVPRERRALDADRKLDDTLQRLEIAEPDAVEDFADCVDTAQRARFFIGESRKGR